MKNWKARPQWINSILNPFWAIPSTSSLPTNPNLSSQSILKDWKSMKTKEVRFRNTSHPKARKELFPFATSTTKIWRRRLRNQWWTKKSWTKKNRENIVFWFLNFFDLIWIFDWVIDQGLAMSANILAIIPARESSVNPICINYFS